MDEIKKVTPERLRDLTRTLLKYRSGKSHTERRIISSENWWKLRNAREERKTTEQGRDGGFESVSGWLHNVIVSKHADAMEAYPEAVLLPREMNDRQEAKILSAIIPCILEQNNFEDTYSDAMWQKMKTGTGVYKVIWDAEKLNGLGDITIAKANILNLYWEPGISDIQKSKYVFYTELWDKEILEQTYPQLQGKLAAKEFESAKFFYDDAVDTSDKATVIDVYYKTRSEGRELLHYIKYVGDVVLQATEDDPAYAHKGLYDHGKYPYVFDPLFPIEGSPCGYGFVDLCRSPQTQIDLLQTAFVKNAMVGAVPRYFRREDGAVNVEEFLDLSNPLVTVDGNLGEDSLRPIQTNNLDGNYIGMMDRCINELRETTGNTETSAGQISSGVTAASAIAALQEASGKGSRDATRSSYNRYSEIVTLCIELIRQFYDLPRQFRITGQMGQEQFVTYTNAQLKPQPQGMAFGIDMGYRLPVFDIKISAQKKNMYTKVTQNELALQFYQMGFFNPNMTDQALMTLGMMEFDGKDALMQQISRQGTLFQKCIQYMQMALALAQKAAPEMVDGLSQDIMMTMGGGTPQGVGGRKPQLTQSDNISGNSKDEPANVEKARKKASQASQPGEE